MLSIHNLLLSEEMYEKYLHDPDSCELSWRFFFSGMEWGEKSASHAPSKEMRIEHLIYVYRSFGHLMSHINPIETKTNTLPYQLDLETLGFKKGELKEMFPTLGLLPQGRARLEEIIATLQTIYCGKIAFEYMHSPLPDLKKWIQQEIEPTRARPSFSAEKKKEILDWLNKSTLFETFLHTRYTGQKRFSLEGGETLIPILHELIETGSEQGMDECVLGMAHRGRLNVLANILGKSIASIFSEFEDQIEETAQNGSGDVKYHKGFSADRRSRSGQNIHISLCANPSHLESVCPVVSGKTLAKQIQRKDGEKRQIIPIMIHGDASFAGQGVVYETMQLFNLRGYATGGTIHLVINNQIGFTTLPRDSRSTSYCTSLATAFSSPVFHVNAEDPEGCVYAAKLALLLRQKYHIDVFIDVNCYRKYGHNEGDEPAFTQPLEYGVIRSKKSIRELYLAELMEGNILTQKEAEGLEESFKEDLKQALKRMEEGSAPEQDKPFQGVWSAFRQGDLFQKVTTAVPKERLHQAAALFSKVPSGFALHPKVAKLFEERLATVEGDKEIDFSCAEHLALSTLLLEKVPVRLAGQDVRRGTFSQRHALWIDQKTGAAHIPLAHLSPDQGRCDVVDSPLSEFAALGFEFGYSLAYPSALVLWEAQYGDFANGGQVMIDQYIAGAEQKWRRYSGLVMLLPHGFEGHGPEHSSARLERFLQLAGDQNIQVTNPTTPAQYFHLLRRQVLRLVRKPLIVMTPKALLRHARCKSPFREFTEGEFHEILDDTVPKEGIKRLLFVSGRLYYDLIERREKIKAKAAAIIRLEQLYPFDEKEFVKIVESYPDATELFWVQEEPENMGAWRMLFPLLLPLIPAKITLGHIARKTSAAVACGSHALHVKEQEELMRRAYE